MKTRKNILISLFAMVLMVLGIGVVKADAPLGIIDQSWDTHCLDGEVNSQITEKDGKTLCYVVGKVGANSGASAGFISQAYSGDGLKIIGAEAFVDGSKALWVSTGTSSTNTANIPSTSDQPDGLKQSACPAARFLNATRDASSSLKSIESAGCGIFYTPKSESNYLFNKGNMTDNKGNIISSSVAQQGTYVVIGAYKVQVSATEGSGCGRICIQTTEIEENTQWTCVVDQGDGVYKTTDDKDCPTGKTGKSYTFCAEVHYNITKEVKPNPEPQPPSGAFASYTILAAGALIAISAITIAKKHNKISKI